MKTLLLNIQSRLNAKIDYLAAKDATEKAVYITTDGIIPDITGFPAIALKDGRSDYVLSGGTLAPGALADEYNGEFDLRMEVRVTAFVQLLREEEVITGLGNEKGILDLLGDIRAALTGWLPDAAYNVPLIPVSEGESTVFVNDEAESGPTYIQSKEIIFTCARQV